MDIERPPSSQPLPDHAKRVFRGALFDTWQWEQKQFDGTAKTFEKVSRPDTAVVFPVVPNGDIVLNKQEQPGCDPFIGAPGGRIDLGETPVQAAKRELLEEAGMEAEEFVLWKSMQPQSKVDWALYFFIAKGVSEVQALDTDAGERIEPFTVSFDEFLEIGTSEAFVETEIQADLFRALLDTEKKEQLRTLFSPHS